MKLLELTLPTAAENIALDEALLEQAEAAGHPDETLRLWMSPEPIVVIGRSSQVEVEVHLEDCDARRIPVLRRCSGGASIVAGPGCLMYALVLSYDLRPTLRAIDEAHRLVMSTIAQSLRSVQADVDVQGVCDLTLGERKFSGNALRCKRTHLLYHGTLLLDFPLEEIGRCLRTPPRQPDYRRRRNHDDFVANLRLPEAPVRQALINAWAAEFRRETWPQAKVAALVAEKYADDEWNRRR
ncbi:lipoate--protein ligase family protein [Lignipirellula cremea]|uniref:Putative lipoate-protein ligase A n=1 Tax=Lignipirellula cremea TaxID=2528010 RepID=A0A518E034_9BACT|nr:lipoate--protein ligase family protein [Lignipirellula cremea]QDU97443.1 putative lipoate-protein ligase A [Lignipirellula cremea]